jgi:ketosteroid isomerase-like protein
MMKRFSLITLMLLVASPLFAIEKGSRKVNTNKLQGDKASLEQTVNQFLDAIKAANIEKIKGYYTADYTFTGPDGKIMSGEERLKMLSSGVDPVQSFSNVTVRTHGNTGVATGIATTKDASGAAGQTRFLQVWTWQGGHWQLAASQVTRISP